MIAARFSIVVFIFLSILTFEASSQSKNGKKIVFLTTRDSHGKGEHEHNGGSTLLIERLKESLPDVETTIYRNDFPDDKSVFKNASTIVIMGDGGDDHFLIPHIPLLDSLMKKGVGLVMIHFSLEVPKEKAGTYFKNWVGGYFETDWSVNPVWTAEFNKLPKHPITNGVQPFSIKDEWYYHLRFTESMKNITPILQVLPPESTLSREEGTHSNNKFVREDVLVKKIPQTMAWAYDRQDGGRGFGFTGGHFHVNWQNDNFRKLVLNAIAWTAKIDVPKNGINSRTPADAELQSLIKPQ